MSTPKPPLRGDETNFRALFRSYKRGARKRDLEFSLTEPRFRELTKQECFICGAPPKRSYRHDKGLSYEKPYIYNGIDRLDNEVGYVEGNCAPCCWTCNNAKAGSSLEDFMLYIYEAFNNCIKPALSRKDIAHEAGSEMATLPRTIHQEDRTRKAPKRPGSRTSRVRGAEAPKRTAEPRYRYYPGRLK